MSVIKNTKYILRKISEYGIQGTIHKIKNKVFLKYPDSINVEIMTVCNLKCSHCRVTMHGNVIPSVNSEFMKLDRFFEIADRISVFIQNASTFQFSTIEPLFHKDLFKMMDYVSGKNKNIQFPLLTNGMLLTERNIYNLCERNVKSVTISLDGYKKETVEGFKKGVNFDQLIRNIRLLRKIAGSSVNMATLFVFTWENADELVDYVDFCSDLGVDSINVNGFMNFLPESRNLYMYSDKGNRKAEEIFLSAYNRAKEKKIDIMFPSVFLKRTGCSLFSYICITEHGDVSPCIMLARKTPFELMNKTKVVDPLIFGNIFNEDIFSIWNNKRYVDFRKRLKKSILHKECMLCADAYGVICSNRKHKPVSI